MYMVFVIFFSIDIKTDSFVQNDGKIICIRIKFSVDTIVPLDQLFEATLT